MFEGATGNILFHDEILSVVRCLSTWPTRFLLWGQVAAVCSSSNFGMLTYFLVGKLWAMEWKHYSKNERKLNKQTPAWVDDHILSNCCSRYWICDMWAKTIIIITQVDGSTSIEPVIITMLLLTIAISNSSTITRFQSLGQGSPALGD